MAIITLSRESVSSNSTVFARTAQSQQLGYFTFPRQCQSLEAFADFFARVLLYEELGVWVDHLAQARYSVKEADLKAWYGVKEKLAEALQPLYDSVFTNGVLTLPGSRDNFATALSFSYVSLMGLELSHPVIGDVTRYVDTMLCAALAEQDRSYQLDFRNVTAMGDVLETLNWITEEAPQADKGKLFYLALHMARSIKQLLGKPYFSEHSYMHVPPLPLAFDYEEERRKYPQMPPEFRNPPGEKIEVPGGECILAHQDGEPCIVMMDGRLFPVSAFEARYQAHLGQGGDWRNFSIPADAPEWRHDRHPFTGREYPRYETLDGIDLRAYVPPIWLGVDHFTGLTQGEAKLLSSFAEFVYQALEHQPELRKSMVPYLSRDLPLPGSQEERTLPNSSDIAQLYTYYADCQGVGRALIENLARQFQQQKQPRLDVLETFALAAPRLSCTVSSVHEGVRRSFEGKTPVWQVIDPETGGQPRRIYGLPVAGGGSGKDSIRERLARECENKGGLVVASLDGSRSFFQLMEILQRHYNAADYKEVELGANTIRQRVLTLAKDYHLFRDCSGIPYERELQFLFQAYLGGRELHVSLINAPLYVEDADVTAHAAGRSLLRGYDRDPDDPNLLRMKDDPRFLLFSLVLDKTQAAAAQGQAYRAQMLYDLYRLCEEHGVAFDASRVHFRALINERGKGEEYVAEHWVRVPPQVYWKLAEAQIQDQELRQPVTSYSLKGVVDRYGEYCLPRDCSAPEIYFREDNAMSMKPLIELDDGSMLISLTLDRDAMERYSDKSVINPQARTTSDLMDPPYAWALPVPETVGEGYGRTIA